MKQGRPEGAVVQKRRTQRQRGCQKHSRGLIGSSQSYEKEALSNLLVQSLSHLPTSRYPSVLEALMPAPLNAGPRRAYLFRNEGRQQQRQGLGDRAFSNSG